MLPIVCIALVLRLGHATRRARVLIWICWRLRERFVAIWAEFQHTMVYYATNQCRERLKACTNAQGGYSEHLLWHAYLTFNLHTSQLVLLNKQIAGLLFLTMSSLCLLLWTIVLHLLCLIWFIALQQSSQQMKWITDSVTDRKSNEHTLLTVWKQPGKDRRTKLRPLQWLRSTLPQPVSRTAADSNKSALRCDMRCCCNVHSKGDESQLNLLDKTNKKWTKRINKK